MPIHHLSVLLNEVISIFQDKTLGVYVDATLGAGGHAASLLENHPEIERLIGIDQDPEALDIAKARLEKWNEKVLFLKGNFCSIIDSLPARGNEQVDGILMDLGVSSMQLDRPEKGFSFMREGPLDMRMDPYESIAAADIVNTWSEKELGRIFREFGEEKQWRVAAKAIVDARGKKPITTTQELVSVLSPYFSWRKKGVNPLTLIFQALRICVNKELEVLEQALPKAIDLLAPGGRLAVISFHSLEDRIVKNAFRFAADDKYDTSGIGGVFLDKEPTVKLVTRKPIVPSEEEMKKNPRSRSAKLRVVEKI